MTRRRTGPRPRSGGCALVVGAAAASERPDVLRLRGTGDALPLHQSPYGATAAGADGGGTRGPHRPERAVGVDTTLTRKQLASAFGLSFEEAALAHERTIGGVLRAARNPENCPDRDKDPLAW